MASSLIPYAIEQGISEHVSGKLLRVTGNFHAKFLIRIFDLTAARLL
jgi:hypothetical protein